MQLPDDLILKGMELKDRYFDLKGLSTYSSLCVSTLRDHIKVNGLPHYQVKGKILIKKSEFDLWFSKFKVVRVQDPEKIANEVMREIGYGSRRS